jgi:hypothetical protein
MDQEPKASSFHPKTLKSAEQIHPKSTVSPTGSERKCKMSHNAGSVVASSKDCVFVQSGHDNKITVKLSLV